MKKMAFMSLASSFLSFVLVSVANGAPSSSSADFPCWRGPAGSGASSSGAKLIDDISSGKTVAEALNSAATGKGIGLGTENGSWVGGDVRAFLECGRDGGNAILMAVVDPKNFKVSALPVGGHGMSITPCYANGRLYLRMQTHIACWDLRK